MLNYFFKECIYNCTNTRGKKTPIQALECDEDIEWILNYVNSKPNFYKGTDTQNIESFFRNGGRLACKVANFPAKEARDIYFRYYPNAIGDSDTQLVCLDTSSGFGSRMSSVLLSGHTYIGFDPNKQLHKKLFECAKWYKDNGFINDNQHCRLICKGSETFIEDLVDSVDIAFTSPPYFNLETYSDDNSASTQNYDNYNNWLLNFVRPTIENTYKYLKVGGYAMINIKNLTRDGKQKLFDDWYEIFCSIDGFKPYEVFEMKQSSTKVVGQYANYDPKNYQNAKEPVMCFKKVY